MIAYQPYIPL